jgi:hypothetical protein
MRQLTELGPTDSIRHNGYDAYEMNPHSTQDKSFKQEDPFCSPVILAT